MATTDPTPAPAEGAAPTRRTSTRKAATPRRAATGSTASSAAAPRTAAATKSVAPRKTAAKSDGGAKVIVAAKPAPRRKAAPATATRLTPRPKPAAAPAAPAASAAAAPAKAVATVKESTVHIRALVEGKNKNGKKRKDPGFHAGRMMKTMGRMWVQSYHRLEVTGGLPKLDGPTLFVANHGFGGVNDVNVFATWVVERELELDRPLVALGHGMAWKIGGGGFMEGMGAVPASAHAAQDAFDEGCHVIVFPGGDLEAAKSFKDRDKVLFEGRSGFARLAMKAGVPILPMVTAGAGETVFVLSRGEKIAKYTGVERVLRLKALPVTISLPMGLSVGNGPYLPLPAKLVTRVLPLMNPQEGESAEAFAKRVHRAMQDGLDDLTRNRKFLRG